MRNKFRMLRATYSLAGMFLLSAGLAHADVSACATTAPGTKLDTTIVGLGAGNGCAAVDLSFESFAIASSTNTGGFGQKIDTGMGALGIYATGTAPSGGTIAPVTMYINPYSASNWTTTATGRLQATVSLSVTANTGGTYTGGTYPSAPAGTNWAFTGFTTNIDGLLTGITGGSASVTTTFCLGQQTIAGCSAANLGSITAAISASNVISVTCGTASTANYSCVNGVVTLASNVRPVTVGVSSAIDFNVTSVGKSATMDINNYSLTFSQAAIVPEPATLSMLAAGLLTLGILKNRLGR